MMDGDTFGSVICLLVCGYWWGEFIAERRAAKAAKNGDVCFRLIHGMVSGILEKRKFVGRYMEISRVERFECLGEKFSLTLTSDGDPAAYERGEAA